ncbi:MAG: LytR C-terminal domain-containing protein [Fibrobacteraceae bacterium]|nr:LytR C-terminal domain-containing protein [Fibrobacteraceae bacterium]
MKIICIFLCCLALWACQEEKPVVQEFRRYKGDIEVLNSCDINGAANKMTTYLRQHGFDVVSKSNDVLQNYKETILVLRNPEWEGAQALAKALKTKNVMVVASKRATAIDASIYLGKDFNKIIEGEQGEQK